MNDKSRSGIPNAFFEILLIGLLTVAGTAAGEVDDLPCELTFPEGLLWSDYFAATGGYLEFDDECGMVAPVNGELAEEGETWVSFDLPVVAHQIGYEMYVHCGSTTAEAPGSVVIFDMVRGGIGESVPVLELRLKIEDLSLELLVYTDDAPVTVTGARVDDAGSRLKIELTRSAGPDLRTGRARLWVDDQLSADLGELVLWENLPDTVRLGVVAADSTSTSGTLEFQPIGFSQTLFPRSP